MEAKGELDVQLAACIRDATRGAWSVARVWEETRVLCLAVDAGLPSPCSFVVEVRRAEPGVRAFKVIDTLSFSYRGRDLPPAHRRALEVAAVAIAVVLRERRYDPSAPPLRLTPDDAGCFPTPHHLFHLADAPVLPSDVIARFRADGHVLVRRALLPDVVRSARPVLVSAVERVWPADLLPVEERADAYARSFTQITSVGLADPLVRVFTHAPRIASMAAQLMGVSEVRLFVEDWLVKEPGARFTPWHQDEAVFPFDAEQTITCWIPLERVRPEHGALRYARGSHRHGLFPIDNISDISEAAFARIIAAHDWPVDERQTLLPGDVSFHHGRTIHGAGPNTSAVPRWVLALHCFAGGARIKRTTMPTMARLLANTAPEKVPGDLADAPCWPRIHPTASSSSVRRESASVRLHLRATLLPAREPTDLWIEDGRLRFAPLEGAQELAPSGGFALPGLCDVHTHLSYPDNPGDPVSSSPWMNERRREHAQTGALVLRDMGAVDDEISRLVDVPGLARVHPCGTMILRHDAFPFTKTEPADLVRACAERVERGARWVKIFADWSDDYQGRVDPGFDGEDAITYPLPLLAEAVRVVHSLGGRVAAHAFSRAGAEVAIEARVDSLEHGWGLDAALLDRMKAQGSAWVPLVGIASHMWRIATVRQDHARARWVEDAMTRLSALLPRAERLGVPILAGTDMFPGVTVPDEIVQLEALGVSRETALAAGSWGARAWIGEPGWVDGAPADLVLYAQDPREDLSALLRPTRVVSGGRRVVPSFAAVRRRYVPWAERELLLEEGWSRAPGPVAR